MKAVAQALYTEPVVFLGVVQGVLTALTAAHLIVAWIPLVSLAAITPIQRSFTRPTKRRRSK